MKKQPFQPCSPQVNSKTEAETMEIPLSSWVLRPVDVTKAKLSFDLKFHVCLPFRFTYM